MTDPHPPSVESLPVSLERDLFLRSLLRHLSGALQDVVGTEEAAGFISVVGREMGEEIGRDYRSALAVERLDRHQVAEVLVDLKRRIQGDFYVIEESEDKIVLGNRACPFGDCSVMGDRGRLVQVVWNLLANGVKFTPKGGRVQAVLHRINSHVEIVVSDTGEGIPPDVLPYVFDRFRQADASTTRRHGGLGLGLSIVRHLVELHGGLVVADSPGTGQGATFTVSLPVPLFTRDEGVLTAESAGFEESLGSSPLAGLHALLVEDHEDSLQLLREILEDAGARVTPSATSPQALAAFQTERPDVVVSDIELPGEDGYTLIRKLRDHEARQGIPKTPAVAVTAYAGGEFRLRALRAGFQSFVPKPVAPVELLTVLAAVTGRT